MAEAEGQPHPVEEPRPEEHPCPINNKGEDERDYIYELWKWGRIVLAIWLLYIVFLFWADDICAIIQWTPHLPHKDTAGVFGDYFGALNALFAGMAFAGLIVTIRQQSADLQLRNAVMHGGNNSTKLFHSFQERHTSIAKIVIATILATLGYYGEFSFQLKRFCVAEIYKDPHALARCKLNFDFKG